MRKIAPRLSALPPKPAAQPMPITHSRRGPLRRPRGEGSLEVLNEFVRRFNIALPKEDTTRRQQLATLESIEYLHIADPLMDDPREQHEMEAVRQLVSRRYGVSLDETDLALLTDIIRSDSANENGGAPPVVGGGDDGSVTAGLGKIVADDDVESLCSDPDFLAAIGEAEATQAAEGESAPGEELLNSAPRLYLSLFQRAGFYDPLEADPPSTVGEVQDVPPSQTAADFQDPLGLAPIEFEFVGDDLRPIPADRPSSVASLRPQTGMGDVASSFVLRLAPHGTFHRSRNLFNPVDAALSAIPKNALKAGLRSPWSASSPLHFRSGVSLVAVGASLQLDSPSVDASASVEPPARQTNHAYIVSAETAEQAKAIAGELYPQLLVSCMEVPLAEPVSPLPLPLPKPKKRAQASAGARSPRRGAKEGGPTHPTAKRHSKRKRLVAPEH